MASPIPAHLHDVSVYRVIEIATSSRRCRCIHPHGMPTGCKRLEDAISITEYILERSEEDVPGRTLRDKMHASGGRYLNNRVHTRAKRRGCARTGHYETGHMRLEDATSITGYILERSEEDVPGLDTRLRYKRLEDATLHYSSRRKKSAAGSRPQSASKASYSSRNVCAR